MRSEIEAKHFQLNSQLNLILEGVTGLAESVCSNYRNQIASAAAEAARVEQEQEERERKARELGEAGEREVNYKLKWWLAEHSAYRSIAADCVSKYSGGCIRIAAWGYMKEPQEIDHLLVGPAGVIHIETKTTLEPSASMTRTIGTGICEMRGISPQRKAQLSKLSVTLPYCRKSLVRMFRYAASSALPTQM